MPLLAECLYLCSRVPKSATSSPESEDPDVRAAGVGDYRARLSTALEWFDRFGIEEEDEPAE